MCFESLSDRAAITCINGHSICLQCDMRIIVAQPSANCTICRVEQTPDSILDAYKTTNLKPGWGSACVYALTFYKRVVQSRRDLIRLNSRLFKIIEETDVPPCKVVGLAQLFEYLSEHEDTIHLSDRFGYLVRECGYE